MLVLVGDQDSGYTDVIDDLLRRQSHRVVVASTPEGFRRFISRYTAQLIIVSMDFAAGSAVEFVRDLKRRQSAPILLVFDDAQPQEIAACLEAGAEDCIRKPFHPSVFASRVEAVARRMRRTEPVGVGVARDVIPNTDVVRIGGSYERAAPTRYGLDFDQEHQRVFCDGIDLRLSHIEYCILEAMAGLDGQVLTHALLNARVWGYRNLSDGSLSQVHISSIRRKLTTAGINRPVIRTIHGVGYALATSHHGSQFASGPGAVRR